MAAAPRGSALGRPAGRLRTSYQRWTYPDLSGHQQHTTVEPLDATLLADLRDIARRPLRLSLMARLQGDRTTEPVEQVDLLMAYGEALDLGGVVDLRAGRRVLLDGFTRGALDGAWIDLVGLPWVGLGVYGGRPVDFGDATLPAWALGGRTWLQGVRWAFAELRYDRREEEPLAGPDQQRLGGDLLVEVYDDWRVFGTAVYETEASVLEQARAGVRYRAPGPLRFAGEYFRYEPRFPEGSLWARLPSDPHWGARARAGVRLAAPLWAHLRWTTRIFQRMDPKQPGQARLKFADPSHALDLGLRYTPRRILEFELSLGAITGDDGAAALAALSGEWQIQPAGLRLAAGGYLNSHERRYADPTGLLELFGGGGAGVERNLATGAWLDLLWAPARWIDLSLRGELLRDAAAYRSVRLLARATGYLF